jgi:hypothetical protein
MSGRSPGSQGSADDLPAAGASLLAEECVGENLDQLSTLDMRGDGVLRVLYRAARELQGGPLTLASQAADRRRRPTSRHDPRSPGPASPPF